MGAIDGTIDDSAGLHVIGCSVEPSADVPVAAQKRGSGIT